MNSKQTMLFLCTHNAARSQIAEALINARYVDRYVAYSAGSEPTKVHPCAIEVMAEIGIDITRQRAKSLNEFDGTPFDYVVTMCADAAVSYTHLRAHETDSYLVCRLLLEKKKKTIKLLK